MNAMSELRYLVNKPIPIESQMNKTAAHELPELLTPLLVTVPQAAAMSAEG